VLLVRYIGVSFRGCSCRENRVILTDGDPPPNTGLRLTQESFMQTGMWIVAWLRPSVIAAVSIVTLWWPLQPVAHADQQSTRQRVQKPPAAANAWAGTPFEARCTWPYRNQFPPCMSTWPEGDPNYHGSRTGPTFNR